MKKLLYTLPLLFSLVGCAAAETEKKEKPVDTVLNNLGEVTLYEDIATDLTLKHSPLDIAITNVKLASVDIEEGATQLVDDKEVIEAVAITWDVKNTSDDITQFNDLASYIVTKDGQQINGTTFDSDGIDSELHGGVKQDGELYFVMDNPVEDLKEFTLYVDPVFINDEIVSDATKIDVQLD